MAFKLLKYMGVGIFGGKIVMLFFMMALMPILNAIFLRPRTPRD